MESLTLQYLNEDDRAFGLAGMTLAVAALDATHLISEVSVDTPEAMVSFTNEYYFAGNPSISPKATWSNLIRNYQVTSAMAIANLYARASVRLHIAVPEDLLRMVHDTIIEEGEESCALEPDEAEEIYRRVLTYNKRIFGNPRLHPAIAMFAGTISRRRTLTGSEIEDELRLLQLL